MAKIHEEVIVIKLSKLVKDDAAMPDVIANKDTVLALEQVAQELAGPGVVVEVQTA